MDSGLSLTDMVNLVLTYHQVTVKKAPQWHGAGVGANFQGYSYKGGTYGDIEFPHLQPQDQSTVDQVLGVTGDTDTMTGSALPAPSSVTVSIENGSGVDGQATSTAQSLGHLGFDTVGVGTVTRVGRRRRPS